MKRDKNNKVICGVCAGIAKEVNVDPTIVRAGFAIAALMGFGFPVILYIVMAVLMPEEE